MISFKSLVSEIFLKEAPSDPIGDSNFEKIAKDEFGFDAKKIGKLGVYELYYNGKFAGLFQPSLQSYDILNAYSMIANKKL